MRFFVFGVTLDWKGVSEISPHAQSPIRGGRHVNNITDFIKTAGAELGLDTNQAQQATSGILGLLRDKADGGTDLIAALPGATELLAKPMAASAQSGGGGLRGMAGKVLGGNLGQGLNLVGMLKGAGLDSSNSGHFVEMLMGFARNHAGPELVGRVLKSMPQLAKLMG